MKVLVTCGPSYEPIDQARRITNFSTGALGIALSNAFTDLGWQVTCLKGEQATCPAAVRAHRHLAFSTNDDLALKLSTLAAEGGWDAVLHAAALCDFQVAGVTTEQGEVLRSPKFSSRTGRLLLALEPATKVLPRLRDWFPAARIVGWKYELAGTRAEAFTKALAQLKECRTDACVLNGAAYGSGFAFCTGSSVHTCADTDALAAWLARWLATA
ncbi:MAG: DNA/pantothenate metabolism flavoprotein domain protein [Pedosphaera sp. Tous-C6FEB]|nr:MAG: DNA/pantothenate metabolism flavoprotein domain protein [Pedosphaera sp. Tous-C6FEB]